jgi:hypothetical protein
MKLTAEQQTKIDHWMGKTFPQPPVCPACGANTWTREDFVFTLPVAMRQRIGKGPKLAICCVCAKCSHLLLFDAERIGVVEGLVR